MSNDYKDKMRAAGNAVAEMSVNTCQAVSNGAKTGVAATQHGAKTFWSMCTGAVTDFKQGWNETMEKTRV